MLTQVNFNHAIKIEARYKLLRLNVKLSEILLLRLRATFLVSILFANIDFTHVGMEKLRNSGNQR